VCQTRGAGAKRRGRGGDSVPGARRCRAGAARGTRVAALGTVVAAVRVGVTAVRWTVTYWAGSATPVFFAAGHYTMLLVDAAAAVHARRRGALSTGFFALGHALCEPVCAAFSQDFAQLSWEFGFDTAVFFWVVLAGTTLSFVLLQAARAAGETRGPPAPARRPAVSDRCVRLNRRAGGAVRSDLERTASAARNPPKHLDTPTGSHYILLSRRCYVFRPLP
jgi:hypothetical protein